MGAETYRVPAVGDVVNALVPLGPYSTFPRRGVIRHRHADTVCVFFLGPYGARCSVPFIPAIDAAALRRKPDLVDFLWVPIRDCVAA